MSDSAPDDTTEGRTGEPADERGGSRLARGGSEDPAQASGADRRRAPARVEQKAPAQPHRERAAGAHTTPTAKKTASAAPPDGHTGRRPRVVVLPEPVRETIARFASPSKVPKILGRLTYLVAFLDILAAIAHRAALRAAHGTAA